MNQEVGNRVAHDDRGAVLPVVALSLVVLMVMTAFSVDIGRQMLQRRRAQGVADVIALDLGHQIDGRTRAQIEADPQWDQTRRDAAARNDFPESQVVATLGDWNPYTRTFTPSGANDVPDAVQVSTSDTVPFFFARVIGINQGGVHRSAVSTQVPDVPPPPPCAPPDPACCPVGDPACPPPPPCDLAVDCPATEATGELGSVFAGFQYYAEPGVSAQYNVAAEARAKVLNATLYTELGLSGAAGTSAPPVGLNLDALSYKGLSNGAVQLGDLATALGFGSVDQMLAATVTARDLLQAEANVLRSSSNSNDVAAGNKLVSFAGSASNTLTVQLGKLIKIRQGDGKRVARAKVNALHLIVASAELINGKSFFSTTINTNIPGAPSVPIRVAIIQGPAYGTGTEGNGPCTAPDYHDVPSCGPHTAQVRIAVDIPTTLDLTPYGIPLVQATTIPVVFEAASAYSIFSLVRCAQPTMNSRTDFRVITNGVAMHIGSVSDAALQSTAAMSVQAQALLHGSINLGLVSVNLDASTSVSESKTFKNGAIYNGDVYTNAGVLGRDETHTFIGNTYDNMTPQSWRYAGGVGNTSISTTMFNNLGITDPVLNAAVSSALKASLANLDQLLMDPSLSSFGATIAGADGRIDSVDCDVHLVK